MVENSKCWLSVGLLVGKCDLLLLDEPTEGLAPLLVAAIRKTINELKAAWNLHAVGGAEPSVWFLGLQIGLCNKQRYHCLWI